MNIGNKIKNLRKQYDLSQEQLARQLNVSYQAVSKWETGASCPDIELLPLLSQVFNVSIDYILSNDAMLSRNDYNSRYSENDYYWGIEPNHTCYEVMKVMPPVKRYKVLDMGSGEGKDAVFFARNGYDVTAFDLSQSGIDKTLKLAKACNVEMNAFTANINEFSPDNYYDIVFSSGVLHCVPEKIRNDLFNDLIAHTNIGGIHALQVFVEKPFIEPAPDMEEYSYRWKSGELLSYYTDWEILYCNEYIFDCNSSGIPHKHCSNEIIAKKI